MLPRWLSLRPVVPTDWTEVTPAWMTRAIAALARRYAAAMVDLDCAKALDEAGV